jgi:glycosyltransferase involved in cell wall biosynthesis
VIAPSELALDLWQSSSDLPVQATIVHPHLKLGLASHRFKYAGEGQDDDTSQQPLKVGFCGYPVMHKGWYVYQDLLDAKIPRDQPLEFYHFAEKSSGDQRLEFRSVRVTRDDRDAMVEAMRSVDLDLVIIPALWPETFCYVAHEAVAAGCVIATLESSGNVSALAHDLKQVLVYPDQQALVDACCDGSLYIAVREMLVLGVAAADLHYTGTTSTLKQVCE